MMGNLSDVRAELVAEVTVQVQRAVESKRVGFIAVAGESGYGKTTFLEQCRAALPHTFSVVSVECPSPLGSQTVPLVQPLYPFVKAVEHALNDPQQRAKRRLLVNIGLSVLGMIPLVGSIFDVAKEVMRDMREFRRETYRRQLPETAAMADSLLAIAEETPLVILLDDAQWIDAASVEVLDHLATTERRAPLVVVLAYEPSVVEAQNIPFETWLAQRRQGGMHCIELPVLSTSEIRQLAVTMLDSYRPDPVFDEWLLHQSGGVPAVVMAYLQYFRQHPPFAPDGTLQTELLRTDYRPASLNLLIEQTLGALTEEDKLVLATCAAEGITCSVFIVAQLLQRDPISTVRLLRSLQQRTGVLRSLGMRRLYGVETTVYTFTHAGYYRFFVEYLEHEERVELHSRIAAILQQQSHTAHDEALAEQLAPLIAAHYLEASDPETAARVMEELSRQASNAGHELIADYAQQTVAMRAATEASSASEEDSNIPEMLERIVEQWYAGDITAAVSQAQSLSLDHATAMERTLVELVRVRLLVDTGSFHQARERIAALISQVGDGDEPEIVSLVYTMAVVLDSSEERFVHAWDHAQQAALWARRSVSPQTTTIALSNIALLLERLGRPQWRLAAKAARRMATMLRWLPLADELRKHFEHR
ncbi:MAG: AAA family ATPase [Chlorobi bacterium]|nr:AAA family ATPase [Chlorobiota bacterium]